MLSYQHSYHAGNLADVHKHGLFAWVLEYLTLKNKPLSYIETHAGRGLYDLASADARKTGEAEAGISKVEQAFPTDHPYLRVIAATRAEHGATAYPGSPVIAAQILRPGDSLHLAERHPGECQLLQQAFQGRDATIHHMDGLEMAHQRTPPTPRRGLALIDPSYEVKSEYAQMATLLPQLARKWNVGILMLWYPILAEARHHEMTRALQDRLPDGFLHEIRFPPARPGQGLVGSGLFTVNPPYQMETEAKRIADRVASVTRP